MSSGSSLTSKLYDKIIKMLSKSHETIPLSQHRIVHNKRPSGLFSAWSVDAFGYVFGPYTDKS
jgi:hypothetical protein